MNKYWVAATKRLPEASPRPRAEVVADRRAREAALANLMRLWATSATAVTPVASACAVTIVAPRPALDLDVAQERPMWAGSDAFTSAMESIQDQLGEGPSVVARDAGVAVAVDDIRTDLARWPVFAMAAQAHGLVSAHAEPLITPDGRLWGVITWYATTTGLSAEGAHGMATRAREVAAAHVLARRLLDLQVHPRDLPAALVARAVLAQAVGIVMERQGCDADTAFAELMETARRERAALPVVAALLVDRARRADADGESEPPVRPVGVESTP